VRDAVREQMLAERKQEKAKALVNELKGRAVIEDVEEAVESEVSA
jgi:hypothetical protein